MIKSECSICGARRKFKSLLFDQSLAAYCHSAMVCNKNHPNSTQNKAIRGSFLDLITYEEALHIQKQRTEYTYEESASLFGKRIRNVNMHKLLTGSISFRVQNEAQADYISYVMGKIGTNKITDALHYIVGRAMDADPSFIAQYTQKRGSYTHTPVVEHDVEYVTEADKQRSKPKEIPSRKPEADEGVFTL